MDPINVSGSVPRPVSNASQDESFLGKAYKKTNNLLFGHTFGFLGLSKHSYRSTAASINDRNPVTTSGNTSGSVTDPGSTQARTDLTLAQKILKSLPYVGAEFIRNQASVTAARMAGEIAGISAVELAKNDSRAAFCIQAGIALLSGIRATAMIYRAFNKNLEEDANVGYSGIANNKTLAMEANTRRKIMSTLFAAASPALEFTGAVLLASSTRDNASEQLKGFASFMLQVTVRDQVYTFCRSLVNSCVKVADRDLPLLNRTDLTPGRVAYLMTQALGGGLGKDFAMIRARGGSTSFDNAGAGALPLSQGKEVRDPTVAANAFLVGAFEWLDDVAYNAIAAHKAGKEIKLDFRLQLPSIQFAIEESMIRNGFLHAVFASAYGIDLAWQNWQQSGDKPAGATSALTNLFVSLLIFVGYGEFVSMLQAAALTSGKKTNAPRDEEAGGQDVEDSTRTGQQQNSPVDSNLPPDGTGTDQPQNSPVDPNLPFAETGPAAQAAKAAAMANKAAGQKISSELKDAIEVANDAKTTAEQAAEGAKQAAEGAKQAAAGAERAAEEAEQAARDVEKAANNEEIAAAVTTAQTKAEEAGQLLQTAEDEAQKAIDRANSAEQEAVKAKIAAETAEKAAIAAEEIEKAANKVEKTAINNKAAAEKKAVNEAHNVETANIAAKEAGEAADKAAKVAEEAAKAASTAESSAEAQKKAEEAVKAAEKARASEESKKAAKEAAETAKKAAQEANNEAIVAEKAVETAAAELAAAKKKSITAKENAKTAKNIADQVKKIAEEAKADADRAATEVKAAKISAGRATKAVEAAKISADRATKAADETEKTDVEKKGKAPADTRVAQASSVASTSSAGIAASMSALSDPINIPLPPSRPETPSASDHEASARPASSSSTEQKPPGASTSSIRATSPTPAPSGSRAAPPPTPPKLFPSTQPSPTGDVRKEN